MSTKTAVFLALSLAVSAASADKGLVLSPTALGPLPLTGKPAKVSEAKLKSLFPQYGVKYEIHSGDSPDFHYFEVSTPKGEVLFTIQSFGTWESPPTKTTAEVPISLLQIRSKEIKDVYGLRIGDRVKDIIAKRGKDLKFGAGHFDALMGDGEIYYSLVPGPAYNAENLTKEDAIEGNWQIRSISWPEGAWE